MSAVKSMGPSRNLKIVLEKKRVLPVAYHSSSFLYYETFVSICINCLHIQYFQIGVTLESSFQRIQESQSGVLVVGKLWLYFTPVYSYFKAFSSELPFLFEQFVSLIFFSDLSITLAFRSKSLNVPHY